MPNLDRHVFICVNERPEDSPKGSCSRAGGDEVASRMKARLHELGLKRVVRANRSACLGECAHGASMVIYPDGVWYGGVQPGDVEEIITEHLLAGRPVARLRLSEDQLVGRGVRACDVVAPSGAGGCGGEGGSPEPVHEDTASPG